MFFLSNSLSGASLKALKCHEMTVASIFTLRGHPTSTWSKNVNVEY